MSASTQAFRRKKKSAPSVPGQERLQLHKTGIFKLKQSKGQGEDMQEMSIMRFWV